MIKLILNLTFIATLFADKNISIHNNIEFKKIDLEISLIDKFLSSDNNIWLKSYSNYNLYLNIETKLKAINFELISNKTDRKLLSSQAILEKQLQLFGSMISPFEKLLQPSNVEIAEPITNPFQILTSLSHINQNIQHKDDYGNKIESIKPILEKLQRKNILSLEKQKFGQISLENILKTQTDIKFFEETLEILKTTFEIYKQKIDEVNLEIKAQIIEHSKTVLFIVLILISLIAFSFFLKFLVGKYMDDNQRVYLGNKAINIITITIIILVITFNYIDNIDNIITILGFASAGLAIAMKDGFMSIFGWFVIIFGGSIKSGDRIKVTMHGAEYVGDILDVSLLRITLQEDVTLTTYNVNRRAGRIIFVPNNYIFTNLIVNYSHYTLRTVWDGIDIIITFDSNHKKASHLMKEIAKNYASGYTDMTRKQLNRLRDRYNLRNTNVEPKMLSFIDEYGIKLSVWYLTNAYATLTLRSNISVKIIDAFNNEDDIHIAYPTQKIVFSKA